MALAPLLACENAHTAEPFAAGNAHFSVSSIKFEFDTSKPVGAHRVGALCLPYGALYWDDLARPDRGALDDAINSTLNKKSSSSAPDIREEVDLIVLEPKVNLCVPSKPAIIGKPKLSGVLKLRWEITVGSPQAIVTKVPIKYIGSDPRRSSKALIDAFVAGYTMFEQQVSDRR